VAYRTQGLQSAPEIDQATAEYRQNEDHVGRFLSECVTTDPNTVTPKADLYKAYQQWCEDQGEYAAKVNRLSTYLMERGLDSYRATGGKRCWIGIRLNPQE